MSIKRTFKVTGSYRSIWAATNSIGAHIASKLEKFHSKEVVLTDEVCDMLCIWAKDQFNKIHRSKLSTYSQLPEAEIAFEITKTSQVEEGKIGSDLELEFITPDNRCKRALFQAKVIEPEENNFRNMDNNGWWRLKRQLIKMKNKVGGTLSFLMIYVPMNILNGEVYSYPTWEQEFEFDEDKKESFYGVSTIPCNDLINDKDEWIRKPRVEFKSDGNFEPNAKSLTRCILELMSCHIGNYEIRDNEKNNDKTNRKMTIKVKIDKEEWEKASSKVRDLLKDNLIN